MRNTPKILFWIFFFLSPLSFHPSHSPFFPPSLPLSLPLPVSFSLPSSLFNWQFKVYKLMNFDICIHKWNHHHSQANGTARCTQEFPVLLWNPSPPLLPACQYPISKEALTCFRSPHGITFPWALYKWSYNMYLFYWFWLSKIILRFFHVLVCISIIHFYCQIVSHHIKCIRCWLTTDAFVDWHLDYFPFLTRMLPFPLGNHLRNGWIMW